MGKNNGSLNTFLKGVFSLAGGHLINIDLNNAFRNKYYKILVKKGYSARKPLVIYHLTNEKMKSKNINLRLDFELEQNSSLKLIDFFNDFQE